MGNPHEIDAIEHLRDLEGGGRMYAVRGRFYTEKAAVIRVVNIADNAPGEDDDEGENRAIDDIGDTASGAKPRIRGIASSTGVDSYGTEMSKNALDGMAEQFRDGVAYAPTHREREWHEVIGVTIGAEVRQVPSVENAADEDEPAYVLEVLTELDPEHPRTADMVRALAGGQEIGQSIGGWFLRLIIIEDERGYIERIIVDEVSLDHLAATRTPSNEDSDDLQLVRRAIEAGITELRERAAAGVMDRAGEGATRGQLRVTLEGPAEMRERASALEQRHIVSVVDNGDGTATVVFETDTGDDGGEEEDRAADAIEAAADALERAADVLEAASDAMEEETDRDTSEEPDEAPEADADTQSTGDEPEEAAGAVVADADRSEAEVAEETHDQEIDMDPKELRELLGEVVGEKLQGIEEGQRSVNERLDRLEARGDAPTPDDDAPEDDDSSEDREADEDTDEAGDEALRARIAELESKQARDEKLIDRLAGRSVRETRAYKSGEMHVAEDLRDGDFEPLIERAKEEGACPALVHANTRSKPVLKIRDTDVDAMPADPKARITFRDMRLALRDLCRAAVRDGVVVPPKRQPANWRGR